MLLARSSSSFPLYITLDKLVDIHKMFLDQTEADFTEVCIPCRMNSPCYFNLLEISAHITILRNKNLRSVFMCALISIYY